jgi:hypothetical protein
MHPPSIDIFTAGFLPHYTTICAQWSLYWRQMSFAILNHVPRYRDFLLRRLATSIDHFFHPFPGHFIEASLETLRCVLIVSLSLFSQV